MADKIIVKENDAGNYTLSKIVSNDIAKVDVVDVDIVVSTKSGQEIILPDAGIASMSQSPPKVVFQDKTITVDQLFESVGTSLHNVDSSTIITTADPEAAKAPTKEEIQKAIEKAVKEAVKEAKAEAEHKQHEEQQKHSETAAISTNTEATVEAMVEKAQKIIDNLHDKDYSYVPPHEFVPPPAAAASPPGVPAPISLTPVTTLFMGNMVGTTYDTVTSPGTTIIYGGGGAVGSDSAASIGPRNALQFSSATIAGTSGNDLIYAEGPALGNANPAVSTSNYAKEFILNVAGYFITLDDIAFSGVPAGVTIVGATDHGGGNWTLSADYVKHAQAFSMVYDSAATGSFDITVDVTGQTTRAATFHSEQNFRFQYMDVTNVSQVTDQSLIYEDHGRLQEIYILPTMDQPNIITLDAGTDTVYGGRNNDTITGTTGDKTVYAREGEDNVTLGNGNNNVDLGSGDNMAITGSGNDVIVASDGSNTVDAGSGINHLTFGNGDNHLTTGSGDDTITVGNGDSVIDSGDGANIINGGIGHFTITSGSGNDGITLASGGGTINAGDGVNNLHVGDGDYNITTGSGGDTILTGNGNNIIDAGAGNNSVTVGTGTNSITSGGGNDTLVGGSGNDTFHAGLGTNSITGGGGTDTLDYSNISTTGITASLFAGTTTGTGLGDTFTGITHLIATDLADTITGSSAAEILEGGAGGDTITGGGGDDYIYGGDGNDTLTGNTGNDHIYGGSGNNTISGGASGSDFLYGGVGNDSFVSPHSGTYYAGTDAATLAAGEVNSINYSADSAALTINLQTGTGLGGTAEGSVYAFTSVLGYNSINSITGGSNSDTITGSNSDDTITGGLGSIDNLSGGLGTNTLIGGGGSNDYYTMGKGFDTIVGSTAYDLIYYNTSQAGIVINLTNSTQSYTNSVGASRNIAAFSGDGFGATANDANSYAIGDHFTAISGTNTSINDLRGSAYDDLIFGGTDSLVYYNYGGNDSFYAGSGAISYYSSASGNDHFFGGSGNDNFYYSGGSDTVDGGTGINTFRNVSAFFSTPYNVTVYLDASADTNSNGIADYIDRGVSSLVSGGVTYTGFEYGYNNVTTGATSTLIKNMDNVAGNAGNDYIVGNANANQINTLGGSNTIFGLGGNDTITAIEGANIIDGGSGTDMINFQYAASANSGTLSTLSPNYTYGVQVFLSDGTFLGASDKASYWGAGLTIYQSRTGTTAAYSYSQITNVENINGSDYNDVLYGNSSANAIYGNSGDDVIAGLGGVDSLYGGAGNDTFRVSASDLASVTVFDGSTGTDILYSPGWSFSAGGITNSKFVSIETVDVRNSAAGGSYGLNATDIQSFADNGNSSTVSLKLDSGDTFTPSGFFSTSGSGSDFTYRYYNNAGHTTQIAMLNVHYGPG